MENPPVPIAIVGMACRFPGGANSPEKLWDLLEEGRNTWSDVPEDRFRWQSFYHPDPEMQNSTNHRGGHFLDTDVAAFDAKFFGVPTHEADVIDPQQRMLDELAYEALENAGIPLEKVRGSQTGVYVATFNNDYGRIMAHDSMDVPKTFLTGAGLAMLANRVSYLLDLKGPSVVIDTACSGSLVALHQACLALRAGDIGTAITGAANLILDPDIMIPMSLQHFLNSDGRSYSFDSLGDGYGRGEGIAMVVLKRLEDAVRDGDSIRAVIRNTGVGQDGKTAGITLPNSEAQASLIKSVYDRAALRPHDTEYVEAHGTGTLAGDVAELSAIEDVFCGGQSLQQQSVYVASIKANIGHTESTSGIAGVIKAALAVERGVIPPNPPIKELKGNMLKPNTNVTIPQKAVKWTSSIQRASINSFGYGGTNAHCILESVDSFFRSTPYSSASISYPLNIPYHNRVPSQYIKGSSIDTKPSDSIDSQELESTPIRTQTQFLLPISARSRNSLIKAVENLQEWTQSSQKSEHTVRDLVYTLCSRRSLLPIRATRIARLDSHDGFVSLESKPRPLEKISPLLRLTFVFTGQGAQWFAMGRQLLGGSAVFTQSITRSLSVLNGLGAPWSLIEELSREKNDSRVDQAEIGQPCSTSVQIALVDLLLSLGVKPSAVIGHSSGEIAAAYAAGILSHRSALTISYHRSLLSKQSKLLMHQPGAMMAVGLSDDEVAGYLPALKSGKVVVACANSPTSATVSGDESAIDELLKLLEQKSIFARKLKVDTAYHSHHMSVVAESYLLAMGSIRVEPSSTGVKFFSSVSGKQKLTSFGSEYWVENLVSKVKFSEAVKSAYLDGLENHRAASQILLEVGPHGALVGPTRDTLSELTPSGKDYTLLSALTRDTDAIQTVLETCGLLFEKGYQVDLEQCNQLDGVQGQQNLVTDLRPYPWDHSTRYWRESRLSKEYRQRSQPSHELVGLRAVGSSLAEPVWRHILNAETMPWLLEHVVDGFPVFPASGYVTMAIEAKKQLNEERGVSDLVLNYVIKDLMLLKPVVIPEPPNTVELQISLRSAGHASKGALSWQSFVISSVSEDGIWYEQATGKIMTEFLPASEDLQAAAETEKALLTQTEVEKLRILEGKDVEYLKGEQLYDSMKSKGNFYGSKFATIQEYTYDKHAAVGSLVIPETAGDMPCGFERPYIIHPGPLDALIHTCIPLFSENSTATSVMAAQVERIVISAVALHEPGTKIDFATTLAPIGPASAITNVSAFVTSNGERQLVFQLIDGKLKGTADMTTDSALAAEYEQTYSIVWHEDVDLILPGVIDFNLPHVEPPLSKFRLLNQAASIFIRSCLEEVPSERVVPRCKDFYDWMARFAASSDSQELIGDLTREECSNIIEQIGLIDIEGKGVRRIGQKLSTIVQGQQDVLALVAEDDLFFNAYTEDGSARCYIYLLEFVKSVMFKQPGLRILEIGAGTGGATKPLLEGLSKEWNFSIDRYDYTDVSPAFFARAKEQFQSYSSFMRFQELDITRNPLDQGFEAGFYDLVIASSSIHVAPRMDDAIRYARSLMKTGGRLLLVESTRVVPFSNMLFGHAPGWYCGVADGRTDSPLLSKTEWSKRLARNGFAGTEFYCDDFEGDAQRVTFLVAQAESAQDSCDANIPIYIILGSQVSEQHVNSAKMLANAVSSCGQQASIYTLPLENITDNAIYIILDDRRSPLLTQLNPDEWNCISQILNHTGMRLLWANIAYGEGTDAHCEYALMMGLCRSARIENPSLKVVTFDTATNTVGDDQGLNAQLAYITQKAFASHVEFDEFEIRFEHGRPLIPRLQPNDKFNTVMKRSAALQEPELDFFHQPKRPLKLTVRQPGLLDSMVFIEDERAAIDLPACEVEVRTESFGLNFKDVMLAIGQIDESIPMAGEFSGTVLKVGDDYKHRYKVGDRVFGVSGTPYASHCRAHGDNMYHCPDSMSSTDCASIAVVFCTAYYSLVTLAHLERGQTVLIHAGSGGVGQAAIQVAQHIGAEVYVTVGNKKKRNFIMDMFGIPEDHIFTSRSTLFKSGLMRMTQNRGVDVVLNSLSEDLLAESLNCVARFGSFLEIGKYDINNKNTISLHPFDKGISFFSVDFTGITKHRPDIVQRILRVLVPFFVSNVFNPVSPINIMALTRIEEAFRLMQAGKHTGKVILEASKETKVTAMPRPASAADLSQTGTYVVAGGLGGLGLEVGRYLATRGVKHIALLSRRLLPSTESDVLKSEFAVLGAQVYLVQCDISHIGCKTVLLEQLSSAPAVEGIIQSAMVTDNQSIEQMSMEQFLVTMPSKTDGTRNLLNTFHGPALKHIIMFSSVTGSFGSMRGSNYAAANAFQDAFATDRKKDAVRVIALDLGPMKDNGVLTREANLLEKIAAQGFVPWGNAELFSLLDSLLDSSTESKSPNQLIVGFSKESMSKAERSHVISNPMLKHILNSKIGNPMNGGGSSDTRISSLVLKSQIESANDIQEIASIVREQLVQKISTFSFMDIDSINDDTPMSAFGLDSLVVIELKNWIMRMFQASLQSSEISDAPDLASLCMLIVSKSSLSKLQSKSQSEDSTSEPDEIEEDSDTTSNTDTSMLDTTKLPKQPLPELSGSIERYLAAVEPICTIQEFEITRQKALDLLEGAGSTLQAHLQKLSQNPQVDNWFADIYLRHNFLQRRNSLLADSTFFSSQSVEPYAYDPLNVATALTLTAFTYKRMVEAGQHQDVYLVDGVIDMTADHNIYNACRQPCLNEDRMLKYENHDYIVVMRRGHAFKVALERDNQVLSSADLRETFRAIHALPLTTSSDLAVLTADRRDQWAEFRKHLMSFSNTNAASLQVIEAAAFIVCFDETAPVGPSGRALQFLYGDANANRWYDKSLQFVVCPDGTSSSVVEHSLLDGTSVAPLREFLMPKVREALNNPAPCDVTTSFDPLTAFEALPFETDNILNERISAVLSTTAEARATSSFDAFDLPGMGGDFWRARRLSPKSGVQLLLQLAVHAYYGHSPPVTETVSMARFRRGRVTLSHTVSHEVKAFCSYVNDETTADHGRAKTLFGEAVAAINASLTRAAAGQAPIRNLLALKWIAIDHGEEVPALFDDAAWNTFANEVVTVDCYESDFEECGLARANEGLWIHFQPQPHRALFSVWGKHARRADEFRAYIEMAAEKVRQILD